MSPARRSGRKSPICTSSTCGHCRPISSSGTCRMPCIVLLPATSRRHHEEVATMKLPSPTSQATRVVLAALACAVLYACRNKPPADRVRVSGQVEATDVQVAAQVAGRLFELRVAEGDRVTAGQIIARLDTADAELALVRARAERDQVDAQLRLLRAGARVEDVRQAEAQLATAQSDVGAAEAEVVVAETDAARFESLLKSK